MRGERAEFEIRLRDVAARGLDALEGGDQRVIVGIVAVEPHALVVAQQVRRGVRADAIAGGARIASMNATVEPLPLVPPTVMTIGAGRGAPIASHTRRTRSRPSSISRGCVRSW